MTGSAGQVPERVAASTTRRADLLQVAAMTMAENGIQGSSIRQIAKRAGMMAGSLYHHFASKEAMIEEIITGYWDDLFEGYDTAIAESHGAVDAIERLTTVSLEVGLKHWAAVQILLGDWKYLSSVMPTLDASSARVERYWLDQIERGVKEGVVRPELDPRMAFRVMMGSITWVFRWFDPEGPRTIYDVVKSQIDIFRSGVIL